MGRKWRWRGGLVAGAIALTGAQSVQAEPARTPAVAVPVLSQGSVPALPQVSVPALPEVSVPALPQVSVPALPEVRAPVLPQVSTPALPRATLPAPPALETPDRAPVPTRVAPRQRTGVRAASGAIAGTASPVPAATPATPRAGTARQPREPREPSSKRLRRLLEPLAACVPTLGPLQERVIVLRAGLQGHTGQTRSELARTLGTSRTRVTRLERRALRTLRRTVRAGGCATPGPSAAPSETVQVVQVSSPIQSADGGSEPDRQEVKGVTASKSHSVAPRVATAARQAGAAIPKAAAALTEPARSYADDHPILFALAVLVTAFCAVLLVRELRKAL